MNFRQTDERSIHLHSFGYIEKLTHISCWQSASAVSPAQCLLPRSLLEKLDSSNKGKLNKLSPHLSLLDICFELYIQHAETKTCSSSPIFLKLPFDSSCMTCKSRANARGKFHIQGREEMQNLLTITNRPSMHELYSYCAPSYFRVLPGVC